MDLFKSNFRQSRSLKIQLPGIYEKAEIHINSHNHSTGIDKDQLSIRWFDRQIIETINSSLLLSGKKYLIFPETIYVNKRKIYSWNEAEEFCTKYESHLPTFSSQSDVQDLIDVVVRVAWTGPIRMIFIGLRVSMHVFIKL